MNIQILKGISVEQDKNDIIDNIGSLDTVFVLDNPKQKLCDYIESLDLKSDRQLYALKICKEIQYIDVDYRGKHYAKLSSLLKDIDSETESTIIVKGDLVESQKAAVRTQLSAIVQQFVYLGIPLGKIHVVTEQESKDLEKINRYEKNVTLYAELSKKCCEEIAAKNFPNNRQLQTEVVESLKKIQGYIAESCQTEMKVAAAASKKSGKSVVVNSMLECELAPTSLELATPNTCVYKKSDKYYLLYKGDKKVFNTPKELKEYILPIFKSAEFDKENNYAIENMEIGYIPKNEKLASLTIYDTPGPDLAGVKGGLQEKAANDAVEEADVVIFPIDYTKYLTDSETEWLKSIKSIFSKKNKFYSLIFDINKTDERFTSKGNKCIVRVIDFIREKLISIAPEFKDSIIFGTSALTYFNALAIPEIEGYEDMADGTFSDIFAEIDSRIDTNKLEQDELDMLMFIQEQSNRFKRNFNVKVTNLQQIKRYSGMPDLLNYVNYITQNKARFERLNNLMHNIDLEVANIWNKFKFKDLEIGLAQKKEKLEKAKEILDNFRKEIDEIYDDRYPDIKIKANNKQLKSTALRNGFKEKDAKLDNLTGYVRDSIIDEEILVQDCDEKAVNNFKELYRHKLQDAFNKTKDKRKGQPALHENAICDLFHSLVKSDFANLVISNIKGQIENCTENLKIETKRIQSDLTEIVKERQVKMESAIERCKTALKSNYNIDFDLQTPSIDFAFKYQGEATPQSLNIENLTYQMLWKELSETFTTTQLNDRSDWIGVRNLLSRWGAIDVNPMCIDIEENMKIYDDKFSPILTDSVRGSLNTEIQNVKDTLTSLVENVVKDVVEQMKVARDFGVQQSVSASNTIDNTRALAEDIDRLNEQKRNLEEIKNCVDEFHDKWLETVNEEAK